MSCSVLEGRVPPGAASLRGSRGTRQIEFLVESKRTESRPGLRAMTPRRTAVRIGGERGEGIGVARLPESGQVLGKFADVTNGSLRRCVRVMLGKSSREIRIEDTGRACEGTLTFAQGSGIAFELA